MTEPEIALGKPFDLLFLCGPQTESGRSLRDIDDVAPVVAEALLVLASSPLRDAVAAQTNNIFARLEDLTPDGETAAWGSLGTVVWWFSGDRGRQSLTLPRWGGLVLTRPVPPLHLVPSRGVVWSGSTRRKARLVQLTFDGF
jgi:hypothetical protein